MARASRASKPAPAPAPVVNVDDDLTVSIEGFSTITNPEARDTFLLAMKDFGDRMFAEADLLESEYRGDTSDVPQFTTRHIVKAESEAREIEYREKPRKPEPKWLPFAEVGHWVLTGLLAIAGAAWFATAMANVEFILSPGEWFILTVVGFLAGIILTFTIRGARKGPS